MCVSEGGQPELNEVLQVPYGSFVVPCIGGRNMKEGSARRGRRERVCSESAVTQKFQRRGSSETPDEAPGSPDVRRPGPPHSVTQCQRDPFVLVTRLRWGLHV